MKNKLIAILAIALISSVLMITAPIIPVSASPAEGYCLTFDGDDDYVEIADAAELNPTDALTIEAWIKPEVLDRDMTIVDKCGEYGNDKGYNLYIGYNWFGGGETLVYFQVRTGGAYWVAGEITVASTWYHVVGTFDNSLASYNQKLYIDGVLCEGMDNTKTIEPATQPVYIGGEPGAQTANNQAGADFKGKIEEVRIYNRAITADEVTAHYNGGAGQYGEPETGLVAGYHFDEGTETTTADYSGNGNDGTIVGATWQESTIARALTYLYIDPAVWNAVPANKCTDFTVDVTIENFDNLMGFDIKLTGWDTTLISCVGIDYTTPLDTLWPDGWEASIHEYGTDYCRLVALSTSTAASSPSAMDLFTLTFHIEKSCNFPLSTPIQFDLVKLSDNAIPTPNPIDAIVTDGMYYMSATKPDLEFKVIINDEPATAPYYVEYCDIFKVEVYVTDICCDSPLTDYDLTIWFDHTLVHYEYIVWSMFGDGTVEYTEGKIRVHDDDFDPWCGKDGRLFTLQFKVEYDDPGEGEYIWRVDNILKTFKIEITKATLSFAEGTWDEAGINMPVPLDITIELIRGDVNCDGKVLIADISTVAAYYDKKEGETNWDTASKYDLNCDGIIDIYDLVTVATNYGYDACT